MHARKAARDAYFPTRSDDAFFSPSRGDVVFEDTAAARRFTEKLNASEEMASRGVKLAPAEVAAMALLHEIFHIVIGIYRQRNPSSFEDLLGQLRSAMGQGAHETRLAFLRAFPTPAIYKHLQGEGEETPEKHLAFGGRAAEDTVTEEIVLLWLTNQNPAYEPVRPLVTDSDLGEGYRSFVGEAQRFFDADQPFGPRGETLLELLLAPSRASRSIFEQLEFVENIWGKAFGLDKLPIWRRLLWARDFRAEEGRWFLHAGRGPGPGDPLLDAMRFDHRDAEPKRFSPDLDWMPSVVLIAKTVYVWLDQLTKTYGYRIERLDQIPDEELDRLAARGFTGLWLIGLFERSRASRRVKQMRGDLDAVASAYSLKGYDIAEELGGYGAYGNLKHRAWQRGIRLAADMVPNHVGIDGDWVLHHPDWFLQSPHPPYPSYRFGGADLSDDPRVGIFIEEGYWNHTDAAVVFRRHDRWTGQDRFIYHGNDGTSMPWNDTAQLDYTRAEVRKAVIETILHVARLFPIIRFDAAMTLAKRHYKRLWFPNPGAGDAIPSRADYAMSQEEFDRMFPVEFWREVVDTVKERAPDTLLLAEAFWMMEGYFVRTLGMHRVYNSAFMNMLKREENGKYRETIKNVLDFDPEILKRFVNFMNNPDEETAIAQFGADDKYFGVCTLMATMPGLPMFGHGQIEGFHEKYGMEYRRAKWDEKPNGWLVARHAREIFPLLKKRYLFSGVTDFALYDFVTDHGVCEDVYAYTNRAHGERALVLVHNKFNAVRGWLQHSCPMRREDGGANVTTFASALGISEHEGDWVLFRDVQAELEYLRPMREIQDQGFGWDLHAFKYHVFEEFRGVWASDEEPYGQLAAELGGRGVPSIARAMLEMKFRPLHTPIRQAASDGHLAYLAKAWDEETQGPTKEAKEALEERLRHAADGLAYMRKKDPRNEGEAFDVEPVLEAAQKRYASILALAHAEDEAIEAQKKDPRAIHLTDVPEPEEKTSDRESVPPKPPIDVKLLLAWVHVEAAIDLVQLVAPDASRAELIGAWEIAMPIADALETQYDAHEAHFRAALLLVLASLREAPMREALCHALRDGRARQLLRVHESGGTWWLVKEPLEALAELLALRETVNGTASLALARRQAEDVVTLAVNAGYRAQAFEDALAGKKPSKPIATPPPPVTPPVTPPASS